MHARLLKGGIAALSVIFIAVACNEQPAAPNADINGGLSLAKKAGASTEVMGAFIDRANADLAARGASVRIYKAEALGAGLDGQSMGQTVFANDRGNKQLPFAQWAPGDPRREGRSDIAWTTDLTEGATSSGLTSPATTAAVARAMDTWANQSCSSGLTLPNIGDFNVDKGIVQWIFGFGGDPETFSPTLAWDIIHAGWLPGAFFDAFAGPGAQNSILAVTFSFRFIDGGGALTDIDGDGLPDKALAEIYYNDAWNAPGWEIDMPNNPGPDFDVETVALHETGHGLDQAHFGKIFITNNNGKLHFSPAAVMNAAYGGVNMALLGTDTGGHCSLWAQWPNN